MLRELSTLLAELHDGLTNIEACNGVRLANVDMVLPLELRPIFRDGGCVLLADVPRNSGVDAWIASPSRLSIGWSSDSHSVSQADEATP